MGNLPIFGTAWNASGRPGSRGYYGGASGGRPGPSEHSPEGRSAARLASEGWRVERQAPERFELWRWPTLVLRIDDLGEVFRPVVHAGSRTTIEGKSAGAQRLIQIGHVGGTLCSGFVTHIPGLNEDAGSI